MQFALRLLLISILLASPAIAQVDRGRSVTAGGGDAAKGVQRASTVLQLDYDPNRGGSRTIDTQTLNAMLTSTTLVDPAAKKALDLGPEMWPRVAQIELLPAGQVAVKLSVIITPAKEIKLPENAAQTMLDELTSRAKVAVDQVSLRQEQATNERRAAIEKELGVAQAKYTKIQSQLRELRMLTGVGDPGGTGRGVEQEMRQIEVNLAAQRARLKVIEEEIAKLAKPADAAAARPDPKSLWADLIEARQKAVKAAQSAAGNLQGDAALANAEAELAEAKIRAAAAAATDAVRPAGFDSPDRWQGERITLRAGIAEQEARLGALSERLAQTQKKSADATSQPLTVYDIERLQREEQRARQEVDELNQQLDQLRRERRGMGMAPKLLILDGRAEPVTNQ